MSIFCFYFFDNWVKKIDFIFFYKNIKNRISPSGGVGGTLNSIKCLHSHLADELVTGKNIVGQIVLENVGGCNCLEPCVVDGNKNKNWRSEW